MKFAKQFAAATASLILASSAAFADGLSNGSAGAVEDETGCFLDVLSWNRLEFDKVYAKVGFDATYLDAGLQFHLKNADAGFYYMGNAWSDPSYNYISGFYGIGNMAFAGGLSISTDQDYAGLGDDFKVNSYKPFIKFGMNLSDYIDINAYFNYTGRGKEKEVTGINYKYSYSDTNFGAKITFYPERSKVFTLKYGVNLDGEFYSSKTDATVASVTNSTEDSYFVGTISPFVKVQYKPVSVLKYGFYLYTPLSFYTYEKKETDLNFYMKNGIIAEIVPGKAFLSLGLSTTLPRLTWIEDESMSRGEMSNAYYLGLGFAITPNVKIEGYGSISPETVSLEKVWSQSFSLSLNAKF